MACSHRHAAPDHKTDQADTVNGMDNAFEYYICHLVCGGRHSSQMAIPFLTSVNLEIWLISVIHIRMFGRRFSLNVFHQKNSNRYVRNKS